MTFLYKALLKEQATDQAKSESNSDSNWQTNNPEWQAKEPSAGSSQAWSQNNSATPNGWAGQSSNQMHWYGQSGSSNSNQGWHWSAWLIIGLLLLVVGALSGYLFGLQPWQKQTVENASIQAMANAQNIAGPAQSNQSVLNEAQAGQAQTNQAQVNEAQLNEAQLNEAQLNEPALNITQSNEAPSNQAESTPSNVNVTQVANTESNTTQPSEQSQDSAQTATKNIEPMFVAQNGKITNEQEKTITIDDYAPTNVEIDDVPDELKLAFEQAVAELEAEQNQEVDTTRDSIVVETDSTLTDINALTEQEQARIPQLFYQMHIYASEPASRWIKINDKTLYEGEYLNKNLKLVEIRQDIIVWETRYRRFSQVALQDYL